MFVVQKPGLASNLNAIGQGMGKEDAVYLYDGILLLFSHSVMSISLRPHELQHARLPCPSLSPGVCSNSCPLSQWCHPAISSSVIPFSSCLQSVPVSGPFLMSRLFTSGGQSIKASALAQVRPMTIHSWFSLGVAGLILLSMGLLRVFSSSTVQKRQFFCAQPMNNMKKQNDMMEYYSGIKKNEIMPFVPFVAPWTEPRDYHTKWSKSGERQMLYDITYMSNLKKIIKMNLIIKQK